MEQAANEVAQGVVDNQGFGYFLARAFSAEHGGGFMMWVILLVGVMLVFLIIERVMSMRKMRVDSVSLNDGLYRMVVRGDINQAVSFCDTRPAPLTNTLKEGLIQVINKRPDEEVQVAMDAAVLRETPRVEGWTALLALGGNVAVLLGLLGTVGGLIKSFSGVAAADAATKSIELSKGISEALNCTAFGLGVAIIALVAYGFLQIRIERILTDMREGSMRVMNLVVANRDKIKV